MGRAQWATHPNTAPMLKTESIHEASVFIDASQVNGCGAVFARPSSRIVAAATAVAGPSVQQ